MDRIDNTLANLYMDCEDNFNGVSEFAEELGVDEVIAQLILNIGKRLHQKRISERGIKVRVR